MFCRLAGVAAAALVSASVVAQSASAATYNFTNITNNAPADAAQFLRMDVDPSGANVAFKFYWDTSAPGSIANVYFDDGANNLLTMTCCTVSAGVSFAADGAPPNLPGGENLNPDFVSDFRAGATPPPASNGVANLGEFVTLLFSLEAGESIATVIAALNSGDLRVGMHVISIGAFSDSFVNLSPVPLPPALLLFGTVLAGYGYLTRRRRTNAAQPAH